MLTEKKRARFIIGKRRVTVWCCVAKHSFCSVKNRLPHYFFSLIQFSLNCFRWDFSSSCVFDSFHPNWLYSDIFIITASFVIIKQFVSRCILHPLQNWQVSRTKNNRMGKNALVVWYGFWALNESFACSTLLYRGYFVSDLWMLMSFPFNRHHSTIHSYSFSCFSRLITAKMRIWWLFSISISLFLILVYFSWRDFITHSMVFIVLSFGMRMYSKHRHISSNEKGCSHAKRQPHYTHTYIRRAIGVCMLCKARKWTISLAITKYLERKLNLISRLFHIPNIIAIERSLCW